MQARRRDELGRPEHPQLWQWCLTICRLGQDYGFGWSFQNCLRRPMRGASLRLWTAWRSTRPTPHRKEGKWPGTIDETTEPWSGSVGTADRHRVMRLLVVREGDGSGP
jgi:hypothetical protein